MSQSAEATARPSGPPRRRLLPLGTAVILVLAALALGSALWPFVPAAIIENDDYFHFALWFALSVAFAFNRVPILFAAMLLAGFSLALEIVQTFVPHRHFSLEDLGANVAGIVAGMLIVYVYRRGAAPDPEPDPVRAARADPGAAPALRVMSPAGGASAATVAPQAAAEPEEGGRGGWLSGFLFLAILGSPLVFVEPSPYEALALLLAVAVILSGPSIHRRLVPMIVLLVVWILGGLLATMPVLHDREAAIYLCITIYLCFSALVFALLFSADVMRRLAALRAAYIFAATLAALAGSAAYFGLIPGAEMLMENGRVRATFQDPNVFGPYIILPMLLIIQSALRGRFRVGYVVAMLILLIGLFLSFSRGAWGHFVFSTATMIALMFATEPSAAKRARFILGASVAGAVVAGLIGVLLTMPVVQTMFEERAALVQDYDTGYGGRFTGQLRALDDIIRNPNGLGPRQYSKGLVGKQLAAVDPHEVYVTALLSYGWLGGFAYIALVLITLQQGFVAITRRTPWQPYLIAAYATFLGVVMEGFIIDTDHWRHWYLLLGMIWGLVAATARHEEGARDL